MRIEVTTSNLESNECRPTTLLMADDHPTFRLGLKQVIARDESFVIIGEVGDGATALERIRSSRPDIAVVDWDMPKLDGLELTRRVRADRLPTRIIILTMHDEESLVNEAVEIGVGGFVLKDNAVEDILEALRTVRDGRPYLSPAVAHHVLRRSRRRVDLREKKPGLEELTAMERRVLAGVATGRTSKEIAAGLSVSPRTVDTHRRNICAKLGLSGSHALVQFAVENREAL